MRDIRQRLMRLAKELDDLGEFHEDTEPQEVSYSLRHMVTEYNILEKKHKKLVSTLKKLLEIE